MYFFNSNGFNINYTEEKKITSNDVLLIHGNLASNEWWTPMIEHMRLSADEKNNDLSGRVVCADWRGYGKSKGLKTKEDINFQIYAEDYIRLIENRGMKDVDVVGHSTGGMIAMIAILKRPDLFRSCFFLDTVGPTGLKPELPIETVLNHFEKMSQDKDYARMVLAASIEGVDMESPMFKEIFELTWNCDPACWTGVPDVLCNDIDISEDIKKDWNLPSMIVHGEKDVILPLKGSRELSEFLPNSQFKVLGGQGHSCNVENPKRFRDLLNEFWNSL